jgi:hypothetical protein
MLGAGGDAGGPGRNELLLTSQMAAWIRMRERPSRSHGFTPQTCPSNTVITVPGTAANCTTLGTGSFQDYKFDFNVEGGAAIKFYTTIANTPTYDLHVRLNAI